VDVVVGALVLLARHCTALCSHPGEHCSSILERQEDKADLKLSHLDEGYAVLQLTLGLNSALHASICSLELFGFSQPLL